MHRRALCTGVVASLFWLAGCGPGGMATLQNDSHKAYSFEVATDYRTVHERILLRARQRYAFSGNPKNQLGVSDELFSRDQSSTITLWDSGGIRLRYRLGAEIRAVDPSRTRVDLYATAKIDRAEARLWAGWADTPLSE